MAILYLHGLGASPSSLKAAWVRTHFQAHGFGVVVPDLNLPSRERLSFAAQLGCAKRSLQELCERCGNVVVVGSSFGGFLALHALQSLEPEFLPGVRGGVLLGALTDPWAEQDGLLSAAAEARWREKGELLLPDPEVAGGSLRLNSDFARELEALQGVAVSVRVPMIFLHGQHDQVVPPAQSVRCAAGYPEREVVLLEDEHRLLGHADLIVASIERFVVGMQGVSDGACMVRDW